MTQPSIEPVARLLAEKLEDRGDMRPLGDADSLFLSGRLDSMTVVEVMMLLEAEYAIDLADADFDIGKVDTLGDLKALVARSGQAPTK